LVARANDFQLEHLQLDRWTTDALRQRGAASIADLITLIGSESHPSEECETALTALETLAGVSGPDGPDWYAYWKARGFEFHQMHLTCRELEAFDVETPVCAVNKESFGNAGVMLARAGYDNLGSLAAGLRSGVGDVPGMGAKKQDDFIRRLLYVVRSLRNGELTPEELGKKFPIFSDAGADNGEDRSAASKYEFKEDVLSLGIGILHLGAKTKLLEAAGYRTVGDISSARPAELIRLPSMGRATRAKISFALKSLFEAQGDSGQVDWDRYCAEIDIPLLPAENTTMDGNTFVEMVGTTLGQLGRTLHDPILQKIISERISKPPRQRATLEEIGSSLPEPVTRERIRQREAKLLEALAAALVNDDYARLNVHFRPEFAVF